MLPDRFLRPLLLKTLDRNDGGDIKLWMSDHYRWANYEQMVSRFDDYKILYDLAS